MGAEGGGGDMTGEPSYHGSTALSFLCNITSLSIDQVNFISCQLFALLLSYVMRKWITNPLTRLWYTLVSGIFICLFCFGTEIFHIIVSAGLCYLVISSTKSKYMPWFVLVLSMGYLSFLHIKRQFYEQNRYSLDISGPLMVLTQKMTSLAFSIMDGIDQTKEKELSPLQKQRVVQDVPSLPEFCSYVFQFQSMLAGPLVFYDDFKEFIRAVEDIPSPAMEVGVKLIKSIFFAVVFITLGPKLDVQYLRSTQFLDASNAYQMFYIIVSTSVERCKYYHAWILADAVCNMSGLGFDRAKGTWDKVSNVHPFRLEFSLNLKEVLDNWNIGTMKWLRYVVYERSPPHLRTNLVYMVSAFWHGFYPGYYITFCSGALFTASGRIIRRYIRPYFLESNIAKTLYDFITWFNTRVLLAYTTFAFVVQDFYPSVAVYTRLYFFLHVISVIAIYLAPLIGRKAKDDDKRTRLSNNASLRENGVSILPENSANAGMTAELAGGIPHVGSNGIQDRNPSSMVDKGDAVNEEWKTQLINSYDAGSNSAKLKTG